MNLNPSRSDWSAAVVGAFLRGCGEPEDVELGGYVMDRFENGRVIESRMLLDVWGLSQRTAAAGATGE